MPRTGIARSLWRRFPAGIALSCCLASALSVATCLGVTPATEVRVTKLYNYWRWEQYWNDSTELGALYAPGREFQALLFWRNGDTPPSLGFCSTQLALCQFYPDLAHDAVNTAMNIPTGEDARSAFRLFLAGSFGQKQSLPVGSPPPKEGDFSVELTDMVLPALEPPDAIRERKVRPASETEGLVADLACPPDLANCELHLLIPFYNQNDLWVPVYRECRKCENPRPLIIFMRYVQGHWWHGARDFDDDRALVERTRSKIEKALMIEVRR